MRFALYLVWQLAKIPLAVLAMPLLLLSLLVLAPICWVGHQYGVFKGTRPSYLGSFDLK
jgi:hypothetical protein